jgi:PAS domain S-box-containing protein
MEGDMETVALRSKVALVGGGSRAKAFLEVLDRQGALSSVLGVADLDESAPGLRFARERGLLATREFRDLYSLPGLEVLLEVTGDDGVLEELLRTRPGQVTVIDHTRAKLAAEGLVRLTDLIKREEAESKDEFLWAVRNSLILNIAVLDKEGNIVAVNQAWERYSRENGGDPSRTGVGVNYLGVCRTASGKFSEGAQEALAGIQAVMEGATARFVLEYPCPSDEVQRWFSLYATPSLETGRVVVAHLDITERKLAEKELSKYRLTLEEMVDERTAKLKTANEQLRQEITERKWAEEALRESEQRYRHLFENLDDAAFLADAQTGIILETNKQAEALLGRTRDEIVGMHQTRLHPPEEAEKYRKIFAAHGAARRATDLDAGIVKRDGTVVPVSISGSTTTIGERQVILGLFRDVTERKRAEEARRAAEQRFRVAFCEAPIGMALATPDGHFLDVNHAMCRMLGYSREELLATDFASITHPDDVETSWEHFRRALADELDTYRMEKRYLRKDGQAVWALVAVSVVRDAAGAPLHFIGQMEDITERKRAEEALAGSEERYRSLVENQRDCIKLLDLKGRYLALNRAGIKALGRPLEKILGGKYADDLDPADGPAVAEAIGRATSGEVVNFEARSTPGAPKATIWRVTLVPLRGPAGKVDRLLGCSRDVTEERQAEEAIRRAAEGLARVGRLKDEFLSMASHELKTPVTSIKVYSELALKRPEKAAPRLPEILATINRQADHLVSLVNDLLDVSRLQLDRVRLEFEPCDLREVLAEICDLSRHLYADHPLICEPPPEPILVRADRSRLVQVLQNLIDNAAKYSPAGSPIDVEVECGPAEVRMAVRDRGIGIAPEDLPHIFERFYKPKREQAVLPGLGLGLYISKQIVERHGGRIWAESEEGKGSTFCVELPLASQPATGTEDAAPG